MRPGSGGGEPMGNVVLTWAWKCHVGNALAKAMLVYLADRAGEDGSATYPKIDMIMRVAELEESIVRKVLKLLQECGFVCRGDQRYGISTCSKSPATFDWYEDMHRARRPTTPP